MRPRRITPKPESALIALRRKLLQLLVSTVIASGAAGVFTASRAQSGENVVVAVVNGRSITQGELDDSISSQLLPLQQQIYALRRAGLDNLIQRVVLEGEAKERGIPVEELIRRLTAGRVAVLASEVELSYLENASAFGSMSPDEARERLRLDLESQARMKNFKDALSKLAAASRVERRLAEPKLPSVGGLREGPSVGPEGAAVVITEFSDFQCPYCKEAHSALKQILRAYPKDVRLVFKNLPLAIHAEAFAAAQAAVCAAEQGSFWPFHDALFATQKSSRETLRGLAAGLSLDPAKFNACLDSEPARLAVLRDVRDARRLGIGGTPAFVINGRLFQGALGFEALKGIIERELRTARDSVSNQ